MFPVSLHLSHYFKPCDSRKYLYSRRTRFLFHLYKIPLWVPLCFRLLPSGGIADSVCGFLQWGVIRLLGGDGWFSPATINSIHNKYHHGNQNKRTNPSADSWKKQHQKNPSEEMLIWRDSDYLLDFHVDSASFL